MHVESVLTIELDFDIFVILFDSLYYLQFDIAY